jgi:hypothetical protein
MKRKRLPRIVPAWTAAVLLALVVVPLALAGINSTTDPNQTVGGETTGACVKPSADMPVNCNQYAQKQDVFLNGSPSKDVAGTYFFAVLDPGGQADPNDGGSKNLSDTTCAPYTCPATNPSDGTPVPQGDAAINREFSVASDGTITNLGNHVLDSANNALSAYPFDDTQNGGGVYILAVCKISDSENTTAIPVPTVAGGDCKYDAFKVGSAAIATADDLTVTKDAAGADTKTWTWGIQKAVDQTEIDDSTGSATFNYTVTVTHDSGTVSGVQVAGTISVFNPNVDLLNNTVPVDITGVTDQLSDGTNCDVTNGGPQTLTAAETHFDYTCNLSSLPQGELDNTVTVSWDGQLLGNGAFLGANSADFTFSSISFAETKVDDCVSVSDTLGGSLGTVCSTDPSPSTFTYPNTFSDDPAGTCTDHDNTATFTTNTTGTTDSASQTVTQCVGEDLGVAKTATPSYTRTYNWNIQKSVDKTKVTTTGSSATFNYTVVVNQTGVSDSAVQATGTITVTNPNDWESVTLTDVTDAVDNGGTCSITGGDSPTSTIPALGSVTLDYTCTYSSVPVDGTNTATATWDSSPVFTPDGSAQGTASVSFGAPTSTVNKQITPTDAFNGGSGVNLCTLTSTPALFCTLTGTDSSPFTTHTYTYSRTIAVTPDQCVSYSNTAATGTGPTSSQTVTVCGPVAGGLTMGFWQNKNGQGVITSFCGGTSGTSLYSFLTGYNPFKDLTSTTCSGIATYVSNVIKAATCSSSSKTCNSMLKAQMLATALDVYFSDPTLGGDKIFAFNGGNNVILGNVKVDLTKICAMVDGSSGSTCSGTTENASSAFGGTPTCQTVSALLTYAAGQSNSGGSTWYNQVKATQVLAKDTFDSINNQKASTCT